jgi:endonuclease YncB( thermonuclease family)
MSWSTNGTEIDLNLETPEPDPQAVAFLKKLVAEQELTCFQSAGLPLRGKKSCWVGYVGDSNIEHALIINGWAIAGHSGMRPAEMIAREKKRGLWADK